MVIHRDTLPLSSDLVDALNHGIVDRGQVMLSSVLILIFNLRTELYPSKAKSGDAAVSGHRPRSRVSLMLPPLRPPPQFLPHF